MHIDVYIAVLRWSSAGAFEFGGNWWSFFRQKEPGVYLGSDGNVLLHCRVFGNSSLDSGSRYGVLVSKHLHHGDQKHKEDEKAPSSRSAIQILHQSGANSVHNLRGFRHMLDPVCSHHRGRQKWHFPTWSPSVCDRLCPSPSLDQLARLLLYEYQISPRLWQNCRFTSRLWTLQTTATGEYRLYWGTEYFRFSSQKQEYKLGYHVFRGRFP